LEQQAWQVRVQVQEQRLQETFPASRFLQAGNVLASWLCLLLSWGPDLRLVLQQRLLWRVSKLHCSAVAVERIQLLLLSCLQVAVASSLAAAEGCCCM
jgi:hypothetical protein